MECVGYWSPCGINVGLALPVEAISYSCPYLCAIRREGHILQRKKHISSIIDMENKLCRSIQRECQVIQNSKQTLDKTTQEARES